MFGRGKPELTDQHISEVRTRQRNDQLAKDPSTIPGMTQTELNDVITTGTIPTALLREIL